MIEYRTPLPIEKEAWDPLWQGYLTFYEAELPHSITELTWQRFHNEQEPVFCIAAYDDDVMVGFTTYILHRSTWSKTSYCYLEDLFVDPSQRGKGVARDLIEHVRNAAQDRGCERLYWATRAGNKTAQKLYDTLADKTDFLQYRMKLD